MEGVANRRLMGVSSSSGAMVAIYNATIVVYGHNDAWEEALAVL
eukprot:CAMPEP_0172502678 /NCGR_PEP_ID=MMETSP1066-20121228/161850_1 /TAXON_ID=671091 /ORGANISM="Coscinodiscus wailesii, Strain CCMP2513" /LENGTH=43 /DNA_ID= /DNA_START= /DNA_END= /DNA_ORIENTATION=